MFVGSRDGMVGRPCHNNLRMSAHGVCGLLECADGRRWKKCQFTQNTLRANPGKTLKVDTSDKEVFPGTDAPRVPRTSA